MKYTAKAYIKDGKVLCASQMCNECEYEKIYECKEVIIECKEEQVDLKINIFNIGKTVHMQVLEQNDKDRGDYILYMKRELTIFSEDEPSIEKYGIYVRGLNKKKDSDIVSYEFESEDEAKRYIHNIKILVKHYNNRPIVIGK